MKSKVILFCVLLLCSKIVDSIPHSENHVRQRVNPLSNWQVNKNVPNAQYLDTEFTQTPNVNKLTNSAILRENNEDYYSNQRGYNYDSYGYNKGLASPPSAKELLVNYDSPAVSRRLDSYPTDESHPSQVGFDHQQYRNQKWRSQNSFANSVPSSVLIPNDERALVTSVQEPYRGLAQYLQPKYVPSSNRRYYQPGRSYLTREQFQYPSVDHSGDNKYVVDPATRFGSKGPVPYENYSKVQASATKTRPTGVRRYVQKFETPSEIIYETPAAESPDTWADQSENIRYPEPYENYSDGQASETKTRPSRVRRHVQNFEFPSEIIYETPAEESPDTLADQSENIRYVENSKLRSHLSNTAPITFHDDGSDYSSDFRPSNLAPVVNVKKEATVEVRKIFDDKPLAHKYAHRSDFGWSIIARDDSNNDAPTDIIETVEVKQAKYGTNYAENKPVPISTHPEDSLTTTNTVLENCGSNTYEESNVPQYGSNSPNNSKPPRQNLIHHLTSGIKELSLKSLVANSKIQNILARTNKRYVVVHSNGTIEYLDALPPDSQQDSNLRLVHTKRKNIDGSEGDGVLTPHSPQPSNIAMTPAPVDEYLWPTNNQPVDEFDSNRVTPFKDLPAGQSYLKPLLLHAEQPVDNENSKPLPLPVNQLADGGYSKPLIPNEDRLLDDGNSNQPKDGDNSKSLTPNEAQPAYDANPKPIPENQSDDDNSKPLPHDVNYPKDDDILKRWTSPENWPKDYDSSKPLLKDMNQSKDKIIFIPYTRNPIYVKRHKHAYLKHPANDNTFKPLLPNEAQPSDDRNSEPMPAHATQPVHDTKPKHSHGNQPENDSDDINSEPLSENLSGDDIVPKLLHPYYRHLMKSKHSHVNKSADSNNSNQSYTPEQLDYPENQPGDDNPANPLPFNKNQSGDDKNSKPLYTNENQTGDDNDSVPLSPHKRHPAHRNKSKHFDGNQHEDDDNANSASENQPEEDKTSKPLPSNENEISPKKQPGDDNTSTTLNENQPGDETYSTPLPPHKKQRSHNKKSQHSHVNKPEADDNNSNPVSPDENHQTNGAMPLPSNEDDSSPVKQPEDDKTDKINLESDDDNSNPDGFGSSQDKNQPGDANAAKTLPSNKNQSEDETDTTPSPPHKKPRAHHKKPQHSHVDKPAKDDDLKPSPVNQLRDDNNLKSAKHSHGYQPADNNNSKPSSSHENQPEDDKNSKLSKPLPGNQPANDDNLQSSFENQPASDSTSPETQPENVISQPLPTQTTQSKDSRGTQPANDSTPKPLPLNENNTSPDKHPENDDSSKQLHSPKNQSADENYYKPLPPNKRRPARRNKSKHSNVNKPTNQLAEDNYTKPSPSNANQPGDETYSTPLPPHKKQRSHNKKSQHSHVNKPEADDNNSNPVSPDENHQTNGAMPLPSNEDDSSPVKQPEDDKTDKINLESDDDNSNPDGFGSSQDKNQPGDANAAKTLPSNKNQSKDETDTTPSPPHKKPRAHHKKPQHSHVDKPAKDDDLKPSPVNQLGDDNNLKSPKHSHGYQSADNNNSKPSSSHENQPEDDKNSKLSKPLPGNQPANDDNLQSSFENQPASDSTSPETQPENVISQPLPTQITQSKDSRGTQPANDSTSKPLPLNENNTSPDKHPENDDSSKQLHSPKNQSADENYYKPLPPNKRRPARRNKSKHSNVNKPTNQLAEDNYTKPSPSNANQSVDETDSTPSLSHKKQRPHHKKPKHSHVNKSIDNNSSKTSPDQSQPEYYKKSKSLPASENPLTNDNNSKPSAPEENQLKDDIKPKLLPASENKPNDDLNSKPTPSVLSKNGDESESMTLSPTVLNYTTSPKPQVTKKHKRKHSHRKTTTNSPVVSTTASPDDSSEDQIFALSPIEQVTHNVSDVPTLTTTTAKPGETPDKKGTYKDAYNKPDEAQDDTKSSSEDLASISDKVQTSTTETPSSSTSPTDDASDDKSKRKSEENENKAVVSKENNEKDNTQTAVYNLSELLDTNTDVPEETDDYSPVTRSPSDQNDVNTGGASGDNLSELEQSESDVTITVSSSITNDSEDDIITINIEVLESTDDADSPSNDKTLVISIDKNPDNDDDSKTLQTDVSKTTTTEDCKVVNNHDDGRGKNVKIDLSNLKSEPTMWIKTTNQDFIDKLTAKNDTQFDVIYVFRIENQPTIERDKETTIFCNGTVVRETKEITYAHKYDPTPTIVKTTEIMQIEDYELCK